MSTVVMRAMWASNSSMQLYYSHAAQQERRHEALAATHVMFIPRPFASASSLVSASASKNLHSPGFKKPEVIEWQENMPSNNGTFIGTIGRDVQIQYLSSGKIVAHSSMRVKRYLQDDSWFYLEFWGDLAEVAAAHLKIGDRIFVSGSVWQEKVIGRDGLQKTFGKVVAKDLKLVQHNSSEYAASLQNYKLKMDKLWNDLFENRTDWLDTRGSKKTERHPDFKHKFLNTSLWLKNRYTPDWVKERLMNEGEGAQKLQSLNSHTSQRLSGKPLCGIELLNTRIFCHGKSLEPSQLHPGIRGFPLTTHCGYASKSDSSFVK